MEYQITIVHQDGDIVLPFKNGGYFFDERGFGISVEAEAVREEDFARHPNCAFLASCGHPPQNPLSEGAVFEAEGGIAHDYDGNTPHAHAYFGFFAEKVSMSWRILSLEEDQIVVSVEVVTDDVNYYDNRAKPQPTTGVFRISRRDPRDLWMPF